MSIFGIQPTHPMPQAAANGSSLVVAELGTGDIMASAGAIFSSDTGSVSFACWFKLGSVSNDGKLLFSNKQNTSSSGLDTEYDQFQLKTGFGGRLIFEIAGSNAQENKFTQAPGVVSDDTWAHFAFTLDGDTLKIYLDGLDVDWVNNWTVNVNDTFASAMMNGSATNPLRMFGTSEGTQFSDARGWNNTVLTPAQISQVASRNVSAPSGDAEYPINEGTGSTFADSVGSNDMSGDLASWVGTDPLPST